MRSIFQLWICINHHVFLEHSEKDSWGHLKHCLIYVTIHFFCCEFSDCSWTKPIYLKRLYHSSTQLESPLILAFILFYFIRVILIPSIMHSRKLNNSLNISKVWAGSKHSHNRHRIFNILKRICILKLNLQILWLNSRNNLFHGLFRNNIACGGNILFYLIWIILSPEQFLD